MSVTEPHFWLALLQIAWINILLSGDNAVVIALACRRLSPTQQRWGMVLGAGVALVLRILFTGVATELLALPWLKVVGALALFYIAVDLVGSGDDEGKDVKASETLWQAIATIAVADLIMSLDNVVAIAAAAHGDLILMVIGLALTVPLLVAGSTLITTLFDRLPILVTLGGALLGWVAGEMLMGDAAIAERIGADTAEAWQLYVGIAVAVLVVAVGHGRLWLARRHQHASE
ncbi:MAG TPA: TerC family protein [Hyphomicrobiales bacterium]|nr:TerC family protein [Hyphomicrobiales bacterium]